MELQKFHGIFACYWKRGYIHIILLYSFLMVSYKFKATTVLLLKYGQNDIDFEEVWVLP